MLILQFLLFSMFTLWQIGCCTYTSNWEPNPRCNLTISSPRLNSLQGLVFTNDHENGTRYLFSVCGLHKTNKTDVDTEDIDLSTSVLFMVGDKNVIPIGRMDSIVGLRKNVLKLSWTYGPSPILLLECGNKDVLFSVFVDDAQNDHTRLFELQHQVFCDHPENSQVTRTVAFSLATSIAVCLMFGLICMIVRSNARFSFTLPSLTRRLKLRHWRFNSRRFARPEVKYSPISDATNGFATSVSINAGRTPLLSNARTIIREDDPQDDLLLSL